jgi:single-strand DNA-binding protein
MPDSTVSIVGNITREIELKYLPSGQANVKLGVAVNRRWQDKQGEWQEETSYFDVTAWGGLAENIAESLTKGNRVVVTGRLQQRSWEDTKTGQKRSAVEIVADEVAPSLRWATARVERVERSSEQRQPVAAGGGKALFEDDDEDSPF